MKITKDKIIDKNDNSENFNNKQRIFNKINNVRVNFFLQVIHDILITHTTGYRNDILIFSLIVLVYHNFMFFHNVSINIFIQKFYFSLFPMQ